jgi:hypothetical protein
MCRADIMGYVIQVQMIESTKNFSPHQDIPMEIHRVLQQYNDVFSNKTGLPPRRDCDHSIPLKDGSKPPNIRPYRIPHKQKDEVAKLIKSMLQEAIIRPSSSPYSSPAILVWKKMDFGGFVLITGN